MGERVISYSHSGNALGELDTRLVRTWLLDREVNPERAQFIINPQKTDYELYKTGNFICVWSDDTIPWAGIIYPPHQWVDGLCKVNCYSAEYIFSGRIVAGKITNALASGGLLFMKCLTDALSNYKPQVGGMMRREQFPLVIADEINLKHTGKQVKMLFGKETLFDCANRIASATNNFWWLEPSRSNENGLELIVHMQNHRGKRIQTLIEGQGFSNLECVEDAPFFNRVFTVGEKVNQAVGERIVAVEDSDSIDEYFLFEGVQYDKGEKSTETLMYRGNRLLNMTKTGHVEITGDLTEPPFPSVGDVCDVQVYSILSDKKGIGTGRLIPDMRIYAMTYSPEEKTATVSLSTIDEDKLMEPN